MGRNAFGKAPVRRKKATKKRVRMSVPFILSSVVPENYDQAIEMMFYVEGVLTRVGEKIDEVALDLDTNDWYPRHSKLEEDEYIKRTLYQKKH